jgi:hypothetical protein
VGDPNIVRDDFRAFTSVDGEHCIVLAQWEPVHAIGHDVSLERLTYFRVLAARVRPRLTKKLLAQCHRGRTWRRTWLARSQSNAELEFVALGGLLGASQKVALNGTISRGHCAILAHDSPAGCSSRMALGRHELDGPGHLCDHSLRARRAKMVRVEFAGKAWVIERVATAGHKD